MNPAAPRSISVLGTDLVRAASLAGHRQGDEVRELMSPRRYKARRVAIGPTCEESASRFALLGATPPLDRTWALCCGVAA